MPWSFSFVVGMPSALKAAMFIVTGLLLSVVVTLTSMIYGPDEVFDGTAKRADRLQTSRDLQQRLDLKPFGRFSELYL